MFSAVKNSRSNIMSLIFMPYSRHRSISLCAMAGTDSRAGTGIHPRWTRAPSLTYCAVMYRSKNMVPFLYRDRASSAPRVRSYLHIRCASMAITRPSFGSLPSFFSVRNWSTTATMNTARAASGSTVASRTLNHSSLGVLETPPTAARAATRLVAHPPIEALRYAARIVLGNDTQYFFQRPMTARRE